MNEIQEESLIHDPNNFEQPLQAEGRVECDSVPFSDDARIDRLQFRLNVMENNYIKQRAELVRMENELFDTRLFAAIDTTSAQRVISLFTMGQPVVVTDAGDVDWPRYAGEAALVMGLISFMNYLKSILPKKKTEEPVILRDGIIRIDGPQDEDETTTVVHTFGGKP